MHEKILLQYLLSYLSIHPISEQTPYVLSLLPNSEENSGKQKLIELKEDTGNRLTDITIAGDATPPVNNRQKKWTENQQGCRRI